MRTESLLLLGVGAFYAVIAGLYWLTSYEPAGTVMLLVTVGLCVMPGAWLLWWSRRMPPRPEDVADAEPADGAGVVGAFPGPTAWPAILAAGAVLAANGMAFGVWPAVPGAVLMVIAMAGAIVSGRTRH